MLGAGLVSSQYFLFSLGLTQDQVLWALIPKGALDVFDLLPLRAGILRHPQDIHGYHFLWVSLSLSALRIHC